MSNDRAKSRKVSWFYLTRVGRVVLACILIAVAIWPVSVQPQATQAAPPPPTPIATSTPQPTEPGLSAQGVTPPSPDNLPPEVEQARARQAMEAALAKYLRYWGPRYQVAPIEVAVEGEWAHGVARWQSKAKTLSGPIHLLARRQPDGSWQALLPGSDGLYRQWVDAAPESLVPAGEKSQLRTQAAEADTLRRHQATPAVPPAATAMPPGKEERGKPVESVSGLAQPTATPRPSVSYQQIRYFATPEEAFHAVLNAYIQQVAPSSNFKLKGIHSDGAWAYTVAQESDTNGQEIPYQFVVLLGHYEASKGWYAIAPRVNTIQEYNELLYMFPNQLIDESTKAYLHQPESLESSGGIATLAVSGHKLPWPAGQVGRLTKKDNCACNYGCGGSGHENQIDFAIPGDVFASKPGTVVFVKESSNSGCCDFSCWQQANMVVIQHDSNEYSWYVHLAYNSVPVSKGDTVGFGTKIGVEGNTGYSCGAHLHYMASTGYTSWTDPGNPNVAPWGTGITSVDFAEASWSDLKICQEYQSQNSGGGGTCSAPSLNSPNDGYVHTSSDRTITFNWSPPSNCTPDGYTFRVSTSPNMDIVSGLPDRGEGGTQTSHTFGSEWDNRDLWWSVRACKPCTPYNPGPWASPRRFRIEPGSLPPPSRNWEARYDQGDTCWWDPNCNMNPRCTETINGPELHKDWGSNAPCGGMNGDNWVGDFRATINFPAGDYVFQLEHDDGVKLWLNGQNIQDRGGSGSGPVCPARHLSGDNQLRVLLREQGGDAKVHLTWSTNTSLCNPSPAPPTLQSPSNGSTFNEGESITLSWSATGDEYYGEIWGGPGGTLTFGWQSGTSKNIGSQWAGYTYSWHVKARNSAGESGWSSTWTFTVKPAAPSNLSAQVASCHQINLTWSDNSGNEEGYRIYRNGSYVGQVGMNGTSYQDTGLSENTDYSYYVRAFRGSIESNNSNTVNVHTPSCPTGPDLVPAQWSGWQYPIVPASITGTTVVNTLYAGYPTYIDWGLKNNGDTNTGGNTYGDLYIDSTRVAHYNFGNVLAGQSWAFFDWTETVTAPGWHTLKVVTDPDNLIAESNENNNVWEHQFYWTPTAPYADNMENGTNDWTATGLWHQIDGNNPYLESHSGSHSWWYGQNSTGDYDTGSANSGDLTSPSIYIPASGYYLRFWYRYETETQGPDWDQRWVQISVDGGPFNNVLQLFDDPMGWWLQSQAINLSGYAGHTIRVRFHFDTIDNGFNAYRGWYVDDFSITSTPPPNCADSYEPNNTPAQATIIAYGQTRNADICPGGDYDYYRFTGTAGDRVVVDIDAKVNGSSLDSYVSLLDSDGTTVLAEHDDEVLGEVQDSHLGYQLPHNGTYYIKVRAWDHPSAGGTGYFYTIRLLTDHTNPSSAAITSPGNNAWLNPNLETVTASASDGQSGIRRVEFLWHNADWQNSNWVWLGADEDGRDGWSWDLDTSGLAEQRGGAFYIWAFDWAGNWTGAGVWNLGIDRTAPTASANISPMYGGAPFLDFYIWWWGSDNLSDIASYDIQYRDGAGGTWTDLLTGTTDTYYRFVGQNGHTYYFRARAHDNAGNVGTYASGDGDAQRTVQICATSADDKEPDNSYIAAKTIPTDGTWQSHNFHAAGDQDWVEFTATAGITYTLVTTNTGGHADTVLYLYKSDGISLIDSNDDDPGNWPASRLEWGATRDGTYYVKVEHWDPYAYGCTTGYGLSISETGTFEVSSGVFLPIILKNAP